MMAHVIALQPEKETAFHREMVGRVMQGIVEEITGEKSGVDRERETTEGEEESPVEKEGEGNAHARRHDQPAGIVRVIVMHAVEHEVQSLAPGAPRLVMEDPTVHGVFHKAPDENAGDEKQGDERERGRAHSEREIEQVAHRRHVKHERRNRMNVREELQKIALEQADRFVAIGDEMLRHTAEAFVRRFARGGRRGRACPREW